MLASAAAVALVVVEATEAISVAVVKATVVIATCRMIFAIKKQLRFLYFF